MGSVPAQRSSPRKRKTDAELKKEPTKETGDKRLKTDDTDDALKNRKQLGAKRPKQKETDDTDDASKNRKKKGAKRPKQKKTAAIPMLMDDDDDEDDNLMVIDNKDKNYEPQLEEEDKDIYPMDDDDDDDFQEPPPRARKPVDKVSKTSKKPTKAETTRRVDKSTTDKEGDADDETISLFQKIVGPDFEVRASEEFEDNTRDKCGNPVEMAGFRATMKMLARGLKTAVKKGEAIEETYVDMVLSGLNYIDSFDPSRSRCGCPARASFYIFAGLTSRQVN